MAGGPRKWERVPSHWVLSSQFPTRIRIKGDLGYQDLRSNLPVILHVLENAMHIDWTFMLSVANIDSVLRPLCFANVVYIKVGLTGPDKFSVFWRMPTAFWVSISDPHQLSSVKFTQYIKHTIVNFQLAVFSGTYVQYGWVLNPMKVWIYAGRYRFISESREIPQNRFIKMECQYQ
jgi:hypothetical protein